MRRLMRQRGTDSSIGWVSFSDTILFAFGLAIVFANSLSDELASKMHDYESLASDHGVVVSQRNEIVEELEDCKKLLAETEQRVAESEAKLTASRTELDAVRQENKSLRNANEEFESKFERARNIYFDQKKKIADLTKQRDNAVTKLQVVRTKYEQLLTLLGDERRVRGELLGLKGSLDRVAVVFDASHSMNTGNRWDSAKQVMLDWVKYLDMKECKLVVFNDEVVEFPQGDKLLTLQGEAGAEDRDKMRKFLENIEPAGRTNTLDALKAAYQVEGLDTIVLFTDGAPYVSGEEQRYDAEMVEEIYALCRTRPEVPINAVGLGDYFSPELSAFLLRISEITQGTFIGR